jgi:hypothetical protein
LAQFEIQLATITKPQEFKTSSLHTNKVASGVIECELNPENVTTDHTLYLILEVPKHLFDGLDVGGGQHEDVVGLADDQTFERSVGLSLELK